MESPRTARERGVAGTSSATPLDPLGLPPAFRPAVQAACRVLQHEQTAVAEAVGCTVASVAADVAGAFGSDPALFSHDRFHPSSAGYARIAAALTPYVLDAARARRDASAA